MLLMLKDLKLSIEASPFEFHATGQSLSNEILRLEIRTKEGKGIEATPSIM